ncbi:MAG: sigma-70 family RNA polymerase sigma factor [Treponema sp.]|jgi:RNA polymerase sigma factor|nr:sigma-70 family RNA polymerase sigma factor [Treponema sp.]
MNTALEPGNKMPLEEQVRLAKTDKHALNTLLHDYMPFIKKWVSKVFFKGQSREDMLTEAMLAFVRSVQTYDGEQGAFIPYAAAVIRNRLIDTARKERALQKQLFSLSALIDTKDIPWEGEVSREVYKRAEEENNLRLEIEAIDREFSQWDFSWTTLLKKCPKQARSRALCRRIAETLRHNPELLAQTLTSRRLPLTRLAETFPRKALEKYRPYIVALLIIAEGEYPYVYSFVPHAWEQVPGEPIPFEEGGA